MQASYPAIGTAKKSLLEALTEVHLRRLDTNNTLHRRAVAVIAVEASLEEVGTTSQSFTLLFLSFVWQTANMQECCPRCTLAFHANA